LGLLRLYCEALRLSKAPYRRDPGLDSGANFLQQTNFNNACQNFSLLETKEDQIVFKHDEHGGCPKQVNSNRLSARLTEITERYLQFLCL
jgi:hypothetical protein